MSSILKEYLDRKMGILQLETELHKLIGKYNEITGRYLFVFATDINKGKTRGVDVSVSGNQQCWFFRN